MSLSVFYRHVRYEAVLSMIGTCVRNHHRKSTGTFFLFRFYWSIVKTDGFPHHRFFSWFEFLFSENFSLQPEDDIDNNHYQQQSHSYRFHTQKIRQQCFHWYFHLLIHIMESVYHSKVNGPAYYVKTGDIIINDRISKTPLVVNKKRMRYS